jgi:hypothetical protein
MANKKTTPPSASPNPVNSPRRRRMIWRTAGEAISLAEREFLGGTLLWATIAMMSGFIPMGYGVWLTLPNSYTAQPWPDATQHYTS